MFTKIISRQKKIYSSTKPKLIPAELKGKEAKNNLLLHRMEVYCKFVTLSRIFSDKTIMVLHFPNQI